ncbi:hypothetical protein Nepgr_033114 [Nepenthes gracilis]|uniref:Uncharacterized protein n=1 Tax=Nepenthes gracilis TaxID=150966 RepID=A0AAD3TLE9_NEPGR|nr:hypothetical protein Nepgr_033114 [Nepenthes gracilis]
MRRKRSLTGIIEDNLADAGEWSGKAEAADGGMILEILIHDDGCMEIQGVWFEARASWLYDGAVNTALFAAKRYCIFQLSL